MAGVTVLKCNNTFYCKRSLMIGSPSLVAIPLVTVVNENEDTEGVEESTNSEPLYFGMEPSTTVK